MIIRQLRLENFGIYKGEQVFDLMPHPINGYSRPIVLLRGKNGSGKTTLIEAIRLCLHGSLALGSRISRASYEEHLAKRIHTSQDLAQSPTLAKITLWMEYVSEGRKKDYKIERAWQIKHGKIKEDICVWENGENLTDLVTPREIESFLRELVMPGVADLFFFDGEKLHTLAQGNTISVSLSETMKTLLGLHLVEQLQTDLDFYLSRQRSEHNKTSLQDELSEVTENIKVLEDQYSTVELQRQGNTEAIFKKKVAIIEQQQRIASQGSWFAERLDDLKAKQQSLEIDIEVLRREVQDLASGLLPFAIAPRMTTAIAQRLKLEADYETATAAQDLLDEQLIQLSDALTSPEVWLRVGLLTDEAVKAHILDEVTSVLKKTIHFPDIEEQDVIHRVSERDRQILLRWIDAATTVVPEKFCQAIHQLNILEDQLEEVKQEIALVPDDELLSPLVETLQALNQDLGVLEKIEKDLEEQLRRLDYESEQMESHREKLNQQIAEQEKHNQRIQLAYRTQLALKAYAQDLSREKTKLLAQDLVSCFNALCRKVDLVDAASIDADTFEITLYRQGQPLAFEQISAGERQLLAMSLMWALREVSGVPMPIIIDTPLGRLDTDHRFNVVHEYFPRVSHQVILLATDTEVDDQILSDLVPAISHAYYLDYDAEQSRTIVYEGLPVDIATLNKVTVQ